MLIKRFCLANCLLVVCCFWAPLPAAGADFQWKPAVEGEEFIGTVFVEGEIEFDDHKKLLDAIGENEGGKGFPLFIQLNSKGGNFEEAMKIAGIARKKHLSTKLGPQAECLSACAVIFMSGLSYNNSFFLKSRFMHPTAVLGFHAPRISAVGGKFDSADLEAAYSRAVEQIGKKLLATARYRDESWRNPMIKPSLINEMMLTRGENYYFVDTIGKAAEFEIELDGANGPSEVKSEHRRNACQNAIAMVADSYVAAAALSYWLKDDEIQKLDGETGLRVFSFEINRHKGRFCDLTLRNRDSWGKDIRYGEVLDIWSDVVVGVAGANQQLYVPDWYFWPSDKKLASVPTR